MVSKMFQKRITDFKKSLFGIYAADLTDSMPKKVIITIVLMVTISLLQGISLIVLIPLLQLVGLNVSTGSIGQIASSVSQLFELIKIQPSLPIVLLVYVVVVSSIALLNRMQTLQTSLIEYQFAALLRKRLYSAITNSKWLFFSKNKSSNFAHALTNEVERISVGTGQFLTFLSSIMILIVYIIFAIKIAGLLTGLIFLFGVLILLMLRRRVLKSKQAGDEITYTTRDIYSSIIQHMDGMKTIKSFGMQEENINIFSNQTNDVVRNYINAIKSYADVKLLFDVGTVVVLSIMVLFLIDAVKLSTASLFLLIYIFVIMLPQFATIQRSYQYFINSLPAYGNVRNLEKDCLDNIDYLCSKKFKIEFKRAIRLENISFSYLNKEYYHMKNINISIPHGKTVAIVGASGAGKSTIADLVMGLIEPTDGQITVDNQLISNNIGSWRNQIGYVSQETFLFNETIKFNLLLSKPEANEKDIQKALKSAAACEFVNKLPQNINTVIGDRGVRLSGGERQRLAMARALIRNPDLLILDESTSNLDLQNENKILNAINDLHGEVTILMIAHRLSTIKNADYIYLIDEGAVVELGTWNELIKKENGMFKRLYQSQGV